MNSETATILLQAATAWYQEQVERPFDSAPRARALYDEIQEVVMHSRRWEREPTDDEVERIYEKARTWINHQKSEPEPMSLAWSPADTQLFHTVRRVEAEL